MIWLAGFLVSIGRLLIGIATLWRLSRRAKEITDANWTALACDIRRQLGLARRVALLKSSRIAMPQTWGTLRPASMARGRRRLVNQRRRVVLMHELAHVSERLSDAGDGPDGLLVLLVQPTCVDGRAPASAWSASLRVTIKCWRKGQGHPTTRTSCSTSHVRCIRGGARR